MLELGAGTARCAQRMRACSLGGLVSNLGVGGRASFVPAAPFPPREVAGPPRRPGWAPRSARDTRTLGVSSKMAKGEEGGAFLGREAGFQAGVAGRKLRGPSGGAGALRQMDFARCLLDVL